MLLDAPAADLPGALDHLGYVQIDPLNICGRMHDLILRNRVADYREGALHAHVHSAARPGFEHYLPGSTAVLVAYPAAAWPFLADRIHRRRLRRGPYARKLAPAHERLAQRIERELAERGPLTSDDIEHDGRSRSGWGTPGRLVKHLLEVMFIHGRVLISSRRNFRRVYDLPGRVLGATLQLPPVAAGETDRWLTLLKLRQRRLVRLMRKEIGLVADQVRLVEVDGCAPLYLLQSDLPLVEATARADRGAQPPVLLAPLDPLIYDRRLTSELWKFDYIWEAYTPAHKRTRGHYSLPVLSGTAIVGHADPKADRVARKLRVVSRSVRRGHSLVPALRELAGFLGLRR